MGIQEKHSSDPRIIKLKGKQISASGKNFMVFVPVEFVRSDILKVDQKYDIYFVPVDDEAEKASKKV